jgi:hypothetical protein
MKLKHCFKFQGIQNQQKSYLIPVPSWSKTITAAGSKIIYKHDASLFKDTIDIDGPTTEPLLIQVCHMSYFIVFHSILGSMGGVAVKANASRNYGRGSIIGFIGLTRRPM